MNISFQVVLTWHSLSFPDRVVSASAAYSDVLSVSADNRTLHLLPFDSRKYSSAIHATSYQCRAHNAMGVIESTVVDVRASKKHMSWSNGEFPEHFRYTGLDCRMSHRKWRESKQQPS